MHTTARKWVTLLGIVGGIVYVNLVNIPRLHLVSRSVGDMANSERTLFFPAGYAFSIWGLIHLGLLAFAIFQMTVPGKKSDQMRRTGLLIMVNVVLSAIWCYVYTEGLLVTSFAFIVLQFAALAIAEARLQKKTLILSPAERWFVQVPVSLNYGWLSVALIANVAQVLKYSAGWNGSPLSEITWTVVMIGIASFIAIAMVLRRNAWPFALAVAWGIVAIAVRFWGESSLAFTALGCSAAIVVAIAVHLLRHLPTRSALHG